ncbi:MAG: hypothetical protein ACRDD8_15810 [Bacteroidales bacterium]
MKIYPLYCCVSGDYMGFFSSKEKCIEFVKKEVLENDWDSNESNVEIVLKGASLKVIDSNNTILIDYFIEEAELDKRL